MNRITSGNLSEIISNIYSYPDQAVLYVIRKPSWDYTSITYLYEFDEEEEPPLNINAADYFLEVSIVKEVVEVWKEWNPNLITDNYLFKAVLYYAINDSYLSTP